MPMRLHPKLSAKYYGPFLVLRKVGQVAFYLQLPKTLLYIRFSMCQLKKVVGSHEVEADLPEQLHSQTSICLPSKVLDKRSVHQAEQEDFVKQVLIQWQNGVLTQPLGKT